MSRPRLTLVVLAAAVAAACWYWAPLFFGVNRYEVLPGQMWRSGQPTSEELAQLVDELDLRSVLNLRDEKDGKEWYESERRLVAERGLWWGTVTLSGRRPPSPDDLAALLDALADAPRPLLIHCHWGVERAGLASALAVLLEGGTLDEARDHFALRFGFYPSLSGSQLPEVLDDYEAWLAARGEPHTPDRLRHWVAADYVPSFYRARIEITSLPALRAGVETPLSLRVTNTSPRPWRHEAAVESGVHVMVRLARVGEGTPDEVFARSGYRDLTVPPGGHSEWDVVLPPVSHAGPYELTVELVDEKVAWFRKRGSPPLVRPVTVLPPGPAPDDG